MKQIKKILCITDLSSISNNAEIASIRLSKMLGARLTILSCGDFYSHKQNEYFDENVILPEENSSQSVEYLKFVSQKKKELKNHFKTLQEQINVQLQFDIEYQVKLENEVTATIDLLSEFKDEFDLIVAGFQKNNFWERFLFGFPAKEISDETKISTLFMPADETWRNWLPMKILVACALNESSRFAENVATFIASSLKSKLVLSHVVDLANLQIEMNVSHIFPIDYMPSQMQIEDADQIKKEKKESLEKLKMELRKEYQFSEIETRIEFGSVGESLLQVLGEDKEINLLVMGSRGQNMLKKFFLGSNTDVLEEACSIPLLIAQQHF